jgi:hypothetical protein
MKKLLFPFCLITLLAIAFFTTPSCTKDIYEPTKVKDSIVYVTKYDTIKITNNNTTHDRASFTYTLTYQNYPDSIGDEYIQAVNASQNVPTNATYSWNIDGNLFVYNNTSYLPSSVFNVKNNGQHIISMSITCPTTKKVYTVSQIFTIKLKS